jgi:hypothetical protein
LAIGDIDYRVWRKERNNTAKLIQGLGQENRAELDRVRLESSAEIAALKSEIINLKRKPYQEDLGKQACLVLIGSALF